jgi:hypothetical protein
MILDVEPGGLVDGFTGVQQGSKENKVYATDDFTCFSQRDDEDYG